MRKQNQGRIALLTLGMLVVFGVGLSVQAGTGIFGWTADAPQAGCQEIRNNFAENRDPRMWTYDGSSYMANLKAMHDALNERRGYVDHHAPCPLRACVHSKGYQTSIGNGKERPLNGACPFCRSTQPVED